MDYPIRINKYLRDKGYASRREADELIERGLVFVNGAVTKAGCMVEEKDRVEVKEIKKDYQYLAYYKPRGLPTQDLPGKESVVTIWKEKGLYPIGRLDKESEGLLILTNDGRFARRVLLKKGEYDKEYIVTVREKINPSVVGIMEKGMETETFGNLLPVKAEVIGDHKIKMILNEGKRHQIRVMLNDLSYTVTSLKRVRIGNIYLDDLEPGGVRNIKIKNFKND